MAARVLEGSTYSRGDELKGRGGGDTWHGHVSARRRRACADKGHGKRRERDEGDADDAQGLMETRGAHGREGEGDKNEEDDGARVCTVLGDGDGSRRKQTKGETGQGARRR